MPCRAALCRSGTARLDRDLEMKQQAAPPTPNAKPLDSDFMWRVFYVFAALALLSVAISVGGKWLGKSIAMAGHTDDTTVHEIVIGNNVLSAPANAIRFERARRDGVADAARPLSALAGHATATARRRATISTMPDGVKRHHLPVVRGAHDVARHERPLRADLPLADRHAGQARTRRASRFFDFTEKSGYLNEVLAVAARPGKDPFVARCLSAARARRNRWRPASATSMSATISA